MCLGIPMCLVECREQTGWAEVSGVRRRVSLSLVPEARTGDYVIVHAGFAIQTLDENEASEILAYLKDYLESDGVAREASSTAPEEVPRAEHQQH